MNTYVPESQGAQAWDRYASVNNNPLKLTDPTGHYACGDGIDDPRCEQYDPIKSYRKPNSNQPDPIATTILVLDGTSAVISGVEAVLADGFGIGIMAIGCGGAGPGTFGLSCGISAELALAVDVYLASPGSVIGAIENALGYASLGLTWWSDKDYTWSFDENGNLATLSIGKDTAVAARNTLLGQIPESNVDAAISFSQFKYDLDRLYGVKPGGSIEIFNASSGLPSNLGIIGNLLSQVISKDWW